MEPLGAFPDGEWDSFSKMFFTDDQELDFTPQFLGHECSFLLEHDEAGFKYSRAPSTSCPDSEAANMRMTGSVNDSFLYSLDCLNSNLHFISQESSSTSSTNNSNSSSSIFIATPSHENYQYFSDANHIQISNDISMFTNICMMDDQKNIASFFPGLPDVLMGETVYNNELDTSLKGSDALEDGKPAAVSIPAKELIPKRKFDMPESQTKAEGRNNNKSSEQNSKKKPRVSSRSDVRKSKKNVESKENRKLPNAGTSQEEKSNIAGLDGQSSTSYCSEDDNASQEINGGATSASKAVHASISLSGKSRASRGSATDPQSLYARKRRERINERLKILQNLVPNGTKVDISTMLEEAVHYVEFLQLQIKLLSSDDLWMYAPIAYNGMDIGLINQKISPVPDL